MLPQIRVTKGVDGAGSSNANVIPGTIVCVYELGQRRCAVMAVAWLCPSQIYEAGYDFLARRCLFIMHQPTNGKPVPLVFVFEV